MLNFNLQSKEEQTLFNNCSGVTEFINYGLINICRVSLYGLNLQFQSSSIQHAVHLLKMMFLLRVKGTMKQGI